MKKTTTVILVIIILVAGAFIIMSFLGPDLKVYQHTQYPRIVKMDDQKMIEVRLTGTPAQISGKAMSALFGEFFRLKKGRSDMQMASPRARWPQGLDTKKEEWVGIFGLPVPDSVNDSELTKGTNGQVVPVIATWKYGTVAEVLHIGSYESETPTINRLLKFIQENGYTVTGDHEEEYLKGPGLFDFNQNGYYTIIRYRIVK